MISHTYEMPLAARLNHIGADIPGFSSQRKKDIMPHYDEDSDSAEALYRERVRGRLIRKHHGLSPAGCVGVVIAIALAAIAYAVPAHSHAHPETSGGYYLPWIN